MKRRAFLQMGLGGLAATSFGDPVKADALAGEIGVSTGSFNLETGMDLTGGHRDHRG
jgi:hypothetical protein